MLAPHELKNKTFTKALKGYNPVEVNEYIDFLIGKYTEAYRENNELERKLRVVVNNLDEIKDEEESIRSTLISAQKMAEKIVRDANERADIITGAIKDRCDVVIAEFKEELQKEKEEMWSIRTRILDFKKNVFDLYREHIEELQGLSVNEIEDIVLPNEDVIVTKIFNDVKGTIATELQKNAESKEAIADDPAEKLLDEEETVAELVSDVDEDIEDINNINNNKKQDENVSGDKNQSNEKDENEEEDEYLLFMQDGLENK